MSTIAARVRGELETKSPMAIGNEIYPLGQMIRGAFGYIFLEMGLENLSKSYEKNVHHVLYFRDNLMKHDCKKDKIGNLERGSLGSLIPVIDKTKELMYICDKCGYISRQMIKKDKMVLTNVRNGSDDGTKTFYLDIIPEDKGRIYGLDIILNLNPNANKDVKPEDYLGEFLSSLNYVSDVGLNIGKRSTKGFGKVELKKESIKIDTITMGNIVDRGDEIRKLVEKNNGNMTIKLLSDTIMKKDSENNGTVKIIGDDLCRDIKTSAKFFDRDWHEYRENWKNPKIVNTGVGTGLGTIVTTKNTFLDMKVAKDTIDEGIFVSVGNVISKGNSINFRFEEMPNTEFYNAMAMTEMLRGLGERTSFGKGQISVS